MGFDDVRWKKAAASESEMKSSARLRAQLGQGETTQARRDLLRAADEYRCEGLQEGDGLFSLLAYACSECLAPREALSVLDAACDLAHWSPFFGHVIRPLHEHFSRAAAGTNEPAGE